MTSKKLSNRYLILTISLLLSGLLPLGAAEAEWRVAVIMPFSESELMSQRLERAISWFSENYEQAQAEAGITTPVRLVFERYDELTVNLDSLGMALADRRDVAAIIGPYYTEALGTICSYCCREKRINGVKRRKPVIAPMAGNEELLRSYCVTEGGSIRSPFLWSMMASDITMTQILFTYDDRLGNQELALLLPDDAYGDTFTNWIIYLAIEKDILVSEVNWYRHDDPEGFDEAARRFAAAKGNHVAVMTLSSEAKRLNDFIPLEEVSLIGTVTGEGLWRFPDMMKQMDDKLVIGLSPYCNPESGFFEQYRSRYSEQSPYVVECYFYDALLTTALAASYGQTANSEDINACITAITPPSVAPTDTLTVNQGVVGSSPS